MNAVAKHVESTPPAVASETAAIMSMIERMATDASISIERVEQTFAFYQRVQADRSRQQFLAAFADLQSELPAVAKRGKGHNKVAYARFEDFIEAIRPVLTKHGFSLRHNIEQPDNTRVIITAILGHRSGHSESTSISLPMDTSGNKTAVHAMASSVSYGKRYTGFAITGIAAEDEDDDGKAAGAGETISEEQETKLRDKLEAVEADLPRFAAYFKIDKLSDLPAAKFDAAMKALDRKASK